MTSTRLAVSISLFFTFFTTLQAQNSCGSDEYYQSQLKKNPELGKLEKQYNEEAKSYALTPHNRSAIYTIPVVFHVIHTNGVDNISREQILDQLRVLNADFSYLNTNKSNIRSQFTGVAADCQVKFVLASIDPNGNCTDGINRVNSPLGVDVDMETQEVKGLVQWNYRKYLNIWVVTSILSSSGQGTTLGYAQFPWTGSGTTDGIVIRHDRVGTIGTASQSDSGRTLTHEVGHWLGLFHTFQGDCGDDDQCDDTPPVNGAFTNANCPASGNSCSNDNPNLLDMWENYMDYSDGECMAMFTTQQKSRMHYFLANFPRNGNVATSNLLATGVTLSNTAPVANFGSSHKVVCAGSPVTYYDLSCKAVVTARSWTFTGGSISGSTDTNPVVIYQTPGKYKVSLIAQNGSGSNTKTVDEYIEVLSKDNALAPNFEEGFELANPESRGFVSVSPKSWEVISTAAYTGSNSFKAPVSATDEVGTTYSFVMPPVNLSLMQTAGLKFTFYAAYAPAVAGSSEVLRLLVSTDCGNTFKQILERTGTGLAYSGAPVTSNFVPTSSTHWKLMGNTALSNLGITSSTNAIFRIDVLSNGGNPVYLDNINISPFLAGVSHLSSNDAVVNIYPNPAMDKATLEFENKSSSRTEIALYDAAGRKVSVIYLGELSVGMQKFEIDRPQTLSGSLYFVKISGTGAQITKPLTFAP